MATVTFIVENTKSRSHLMSCLGPESTWGLKLGSRVDNIRNKGSYCHDPARQQKLEKLGFVWDNLRDRRGINDIFTALSV